MIRLPDGTKMTLGERVHLPFYNLVWVEPDGPLSRDDLFCILGAALARPPRGKLTVAELSVLTQRPEWAVRVQLRDILRRTRHGRRTKTLWNQLLKRTR